MTYAEPARDLGAAAYLSKPFSRSDLQESLLQVLAHAPEVADRWRLPVRSNVQVEPPTEPEATVLLVEETESVIRTIADSLDVLNCRLVVARNGMEGVAYASDLHPDVILLCVQMSGMDGLEVTRYIRAEPSLRSTPIIALTSLIMPGDRERCMSAGMDDYLTKPVVPWQLVQIAQRYL